MSAMPGAVKPPTLSTWALKVLVALRATNKFALAAPADGCGQVPSTCVALFRHSVVMPGMPCTGDCSQVYDCCSGSVSQPLCQMYFISNHQPGTCTSAAPPA